MAQGDGIREHSGNWTTKSSIRKLCLGAVRQGGAEVGEMTTGGSGALDTGPAQHGPACKEHSQKVAVGAVSQGGKGVGGIVTGGSGAVGGGPTRERGGGEGVTGTLCWKRRRRSGAATSSSCAGPRGKPAQRRRFIDWQSRNPPLGS